MNKNRYNNIIYTLFFLSGISGLIYETVWFRVLARVLGVTVYANSIVIAAFMLGLALGSYFIGKRVDKTKNLIGLYAMLEVGIGLTALFVFLLFNHLIPVYRSIFGLFNGNPVAYRFVQSALLFSLLVIPTFLMGGTLPVLAAQTKRYGTSFANQMGYLYGLNTLGAVFGVALSGFFTIGIAGEFKTVLIGVGLNFLVGAIAYLVIGRGESIDAATAVTEEHVEVQISDHSSRLRSLVLISYAFIGFTSFAIEIIWTRIFQLQLGTSVYAFSMVLVIYLIGSALGSLIGGRYFARIKQPILMLGFLIMGISIYMILGTYIFCLHKADGLLVYLSFSRVVVPFAVIFPVTFMLGFLFPIVTHSYVQKTDSIGSGMGMLYSMNTLGCILGSLICGYIMISFLGTRGTIILLSLINGTMGLIVLLEATKGSTGVVTRATAGITLGGIIVAGIFSPDPFFYVEKKMVYSDPSRNMEIYYHKEGVAATTTAFGSKTNPLDKHIFINGIGMTELVPETKFIAHLPILLHPDPHEMLVICFGMGTCLRAASTHTTVNCDAVELIGEEFETYKYFHANGPEVLALPRIHHYIDDGRNFLLMRDKKYDVISIDPAPPIYSAGTVNLYTTEFFNLCKSRLTPNGVMCLWIPTSSYPEVRMIMKTFLTVFPEVTVYGGIKDPGEIMIGRLSKQPIDTARFIAAEKDSAIMHDMNEWGMMFKSPVDMLNEKILDRDQLEKIVANDKVISDNHPYTEFPMWRLKFNPEERVVLNAPLLRKVKAEVIH